MSSKNDEETEIKFPVNAIEKTDPPEGVDGGEWYEYTIGEGNTAIVGKRSGSLRSVTRYVKEFADNLNQRSALGYSPRATRKPAKKTSG